MSPLPFIPVLFLTPPFMRIKSHDTVSISQRTALGYKECLPRETCLFINCVLVTLSIIGSCETTQPRLGELFSEKCSSLNLIRWRTPEATNRARNDNVGTTVLAIITSRVTPNALHRGWLRYPGLGDNTLAAQFRPTSAQLVSSSLVRSPLLSGVLHLKHRNSRGKVSRRLRLVVISSRLCTGDMTCNGVAHERF